MKKYKGQKTRKTIYIDADTWIIIERYAAKIDRSENYVVADILNKSTKRLVNKG
jgi:hypothetical protein